MTNALKLLLFGASALALAACGGSEEPSGSENAGGADGGYSEAARGSGDEEKARGSGSKDAKAAYAERLQAVLDGQSDEAKARYQYRHPAETLAFFGIKPGMTVVDTLPGDPWYAGILSEYLGAEGKVIGVDYPVDMWSNFGFATPEFIEGKQTWTETWVADMDAKREEGEAAFGAFQFGALSEDMHGKADVALMIRALHNMHRFEDEGGYLTRALADMNTVLKPGGVLGVIQHRGLETNSDEWANGSNGYLKESRVIALVEAAGFELVESSEINANPADRPTEDDFVWRLPPRLAGSDEDPERREAMLAIGESDRMTLLFKKPE